MRLRLSRRSIPGLGIGLLCLGMVGCAKPNQYVPPPPPTVIVAHPVVRDVPEFLEFTGNTAASESVEIRARVDGYLQQIAFQDGQDVEAGQLLVQIEPDPFQAKFEEADATLKKNKADFGLAVAELERSKLLFEQKVAPKADLDIKQAQKDVTEALVSVAEASLKQAELNKNYTEIKSPIAGRISRRKFDIGSMVTAEQTVLTSVFKLDPIYVYFSVSEREVLRIRSRRFEETGSAERKETIVVSAGTPDDQGYPHVGVFDFGEPAADPATGTFQVRAKFDNPDKLLLPGLFVRVRTHMGIRKNAVLIDERAIGADPQGRFVYVVDDKNVVQVKRLKLGPTQDDGTRVVESGLSAEDHVVVEGIQRIRQGSTVTVKEADSWPPAAETKKSDG